MTKKSNPQAQWTGEHSFLPVDVSSGGLADMRESWPAGRAGDCPPREGSPALVALPMPDGGQRSGRPRFGGPPKTDVLRLVPEPSSARVRHG